MVSPGQLRCGASSGCRSAFDSAGRSCSATRTSGGAAACNTWRMPLKALARPGAVPRAAVTMLLREQKCQIKRARSIEGQT